jgi:hypothetical protein
LRSSTFSTKSPNTEESRAVLPIPGGPEAYKAAGPGPLFEFVEVVSQE